MFDGMLLLAGGGLGLTVIESIFTKKKPNDSANETSN
jgi:hypothetical protein